MKSSITRKLLLAATLLTAGASAVAEDIDIYQANNNSATSNLLLVIDNSGAWNASAPTANSDPALDCPTAGLGKILDPTLANSSGGVETCGIWKAIDIIGNPTSGLLGKLNMGLMLFSTGSVQGGTFKFPAVAAPDKLVNMSNTPTLEYPSGGIATMKAVLSGLKSSGGASDTANGTDVGGSMQEAWAFYSGKTGVSGTIYPGINADTCGKNFVIFIGISRVSSDPADFNANNVLAALNSAGASAEQKTYIPWTINDKYSKATNYWGDEWTRFSKQNNAITTYTITLVDPGNPNPDYERFMKSMAEASGGKPFVVDVNNISAFVQALLQIFNEIQAVNSVFAAASLPISTNATGSFLNQVYFGMFRPDGAGLPRWAGNLKQYRFALDQTIPLSPVLYLADARPNDPLTGRPFSAINSAGTGFFSPNAVSYWTSKDILTSPDNIDPYGTVPVNGGTKGGFFIFNPQSAGEGFDLPDGEIVEKGGVSQRIRLENLVNNYANAPGASGNLRRMYTCTSGTVNCVGGLPGAGSLLSATPFDATNDGITDGALGSGVAGTPITTLTRNEALASVTLGSSMSPVLGNGQLVTISGPTINSRYAGLKPAGAPPTATTFTYPITVLPPLTATGTGYTATPFGGVARVITQIVRNGTQATFTYSSGSQDYFVNDQVNILVAGGYNTSSATVLAATAAAPFTFTIDISAIIAPGNGSGGTAAVGATSRNINTITMGTPNAASPFAATINVLLTANHTFTTGTVVIAGATPDAYNGSWTITGTGAAGTCPGSSPNRRVCFSLDTTPGNVGDGTFLVGVSDTSIPVNVTGITRDNSCTGGTPSPTVLATATTAADHGFFVGQIVTISGGDSQSVLYKNPASGFVVVDSIPNTTSFKYFVTTDSPCSDGSAGKTAAAGGADKTKLIRWVRGEDNLGDEAGPGIPINVRPAVHGDVLHSRPAVVNYGGSTGVVLFYGANNGAFHAVNGNQTAAIGSVPAGGEMWSFVASEFFPKLLRQHLNSPVVKLESTSGAILPAPQPKDYYFDGGIGVYKEGAAVHLYLTARRGGRIIYALDVSDPAAPRFMWKKTNTSDAGAFAELGQTWSTPRVAKVKGHVNPVLIFGAGYDPAEDSEPPAARTMGRGIFILDALNGNLLWKATTGGGAGVTTCIGAACAGGLDMPYPIPSDVAVLDRDTTDVGGYVDRVYVGDLGGNIWRVDLEPATGNAPANWQVTKFASVGGSGATKRKLFFPPSVLPGGDFDSVLFATGDREHPTRTQQAVQILNRFYMLKDINVGNDACPADPITLLPTCTLPTEDLTSSTACVPGALPKTAPGTGSDPSTSCTEAVPAGLFNASSVLPTTASAVPAKVGRVYDDTGKGFYMNLLNAVAHKQPDESFLFGPQIEAGEKAVNAPTTIGGITFFGTNTPLPPDPGVCQPNLGTARGYAVNLFTGVFNFAEFAGGGLPPSPVAGRVEVGGTSVPFIIGGVAPPSDNAKEGDDIKKQLSESALAALRVEITLAAIRTRMYWYRDIGNR